MTKKLTAVFDTNVFIAKALSTNPNSPLIELLERAKNNEFVLLTCNAIRDEIIEKLIEKEIDKAKIIELIAELINVPVLSNLNQQMLLL